MSKAAAEDRGQSTGPEVLRFSARLVQEAAGAKGSWGYVEIPARIAAKLSDMSRLEGTINGHPFRAPLQGDTAGALKLRVNAAMLEGSAAGAGDKVELAVLGPEPVLQIPEDLRGPLAASNEAAALWARLPEDVQRDWVRWIELAKKAETRARRVTRTVEQLAEGKRRPCCVNHYEYMLCCIEGDGE